MGRRSSRLLMLVSGFSSLGYQVIWTEQCASWLGHDAAAVLAVLAAFFGGLAIGGLALGSRIERSARPLRWYIACELGCAFWGVVLLFISSPWSAWVMRTLGVAPSPCFQWFLGFGATFVLFLPATAALGATVPAMERLVGAGGRNGRSIGSLYAFNTFGAVLGVLGMAFWIIPGFGLLRSAAVCIALNVSCGVLALATFTRTAAVIPDRRVHAPNEAPRVLRRLALSGLLGIGFEVVVVRVLSQVTEDTVYTFALLLAVYLVGSAAGAAGYQRWMVRRADPGALSDRLFVALGSACLVSGASLWAAEWVRRQALEGLGTGLGSALAAEALLAVLAFGPPTIVMGALFAELSRSASIAGINFGRALGVNTLAAAAAPVLCGVFALPVLGAKLVLVSIVVGYLLCTSRHRWWTPMVGVPLAVSVGVGLFAPQLRFIEVPEGGHVVSYREGIMAAVSVVEDGQGISRLRIDNREQEGSSATQRVDARQAWLPLLLHAAPRRALFLGLGSGVTASAAALDTSLHVDAVELLPEVIAASESFAHALDDGSAWHRLHLFAADARRYVRATDQRYDVIVSDNFHPARSGSGALYTVEHFAAVHARLEPRGLFCQWLPLHQLDLDTLRSIVRSFTTVYPRAWAMLANNSLETPVIGLVGGAEGSRFDVSELQARLARLAVPEPLHELGLEDEFAVLGSMIAGPSSLRGFAKPAEPNTDDRPLVAYRAPRVTYAPDSSPQDRLFALLAELSIAPSELIVREPDPDWSRRLSAYFRARARFIDSGRRVHPAARVEEMLEQVKQPLLAVIGISPDFRPAYDPLLSMAVALSRSDPAGARALLDELVRLQPARPEATRTLASIDTESSRR